jgi:hypothetical protein
MSNDPADKRLSPYVTRSVGFKLAFFVPSPPFTCRMECEIKSLILRQVDGGEGQGEGAERRLVLPLSLTLSPVYLPTVPNDGFGVVLGKFTGERGRKHK